MPTPTLAKRQWYLPLAQHHKGHLYQAADNHVMEEAHHAPTWVKLSPFIAMLLGFVTACWFYLWDPKMPQNLVKYQRPLYLFLLNKWYFDEIYEIILCDAGEKAGPRPVEARGW